MGDMIRAEVRPSARAGRRLRTCLVSVAMELAASRSRRGRAWRFACADSHGRTCSTDHPMVLIEGLRGERQKTRHVRRQVGRHGFTGRWPSIADAELRFQSNPQERGRCRRRIDSSGLRSTKSPANRGGVLMPSSDGGRPIKSTTMLYLPDPLRFAVKRADGPRIAFERLNRCASTVRKSRHSSGRCGGTDPATQVL